MKILQLSTFDTRFGAAIAARRLHEALLASGEESDFLVSEKQGEFPRTQAAYSGVGKLLARARHRLDIFPLKFYPLRSYSDFSPNWVSSNLPDRIDRLRPEVVHLHWCLNDFVPTPILPRLGRPLIWTFHDMWAFTGGCHYSSGCDRYHVECGGCPVLKSTNTNDLSHWLWRQKKEAYRKVRKSLQIICPSTWMAGLARNAPLLEGIPVHVVPNPINTQSFKPAGKKENRRLFGLPEEGPLLLMGAPSNADRRKGFDLLNEALQHYAQQPNAQPLGLVMLGPKVDVVAAKSGRLTVWNIDFVHQEPRLAALYNAVDAVALPSREENLSNTLAEALCCGTPCLTFDIGGNADLISHQINGFMAPAGDTVGMAAGLTWILGNLGEEKRDSISKLARAKVSYESLAPTFLDIYSTALDGPRIS